MHQRKNQLQYWIVAFVGLFILLVIITQYCGGHIDEGDDGSGQYIPFTQYKVSTHHRRVLLTGGAGFIGSHTAEALLKRGDDVIVVDEINDYYDVRIKKRNLSILKDISRSSSSSGKFTSHAFDICDKERMQNIFELEATKGKPITDIVHLAARAGVRASIQDPYVYAHSNVRGTLVMLDMARDFNVSNFVYASSSSVYGTNEKIPFAETDRVDHPVSPYAATKKSTEMLCETYNHLYGIPMSGLRFFTVYGPRGRPDMAPFKFVDLISRGSAIDRYGDGSTSRDYTYVSDIVQGVCAALDRPFPKHQVFNLGNSQTVMLSQFINVVETAVGKKAEIRELPPQPGDVPRTFADLTKSKRLLGYNPQVSIEQGIANTVQWYHKEYAHLLR